MGKMKIKIQSPDSVSYIPNHYEGPDKYKGKEFYTCLNEKCRFKWRGNPGPQGHCFKCQGIFMKWETFETDWVYHENEWKRKEFVNEHQPTDKEQPDNSGGTGQE